jgi:hypothetical protein
MVRDARHIGSFFNIYLARRETTRVVMQQTASEATTIMHLLTNHVGEVWSLTLTPITRPHLPIRPQITLSCAMLSTRGPRSGSSEADF